MKIKFVTIFLIMLFLSIGAAFATNDTADVLDSNIDDRVVVEAAYEEIKNSSETEIIEEEVSDGYSLDSNQENYDNIRDCPIIV